MQSLESGHCALLLVFHCLWKYYNNGNLLLGVIYSPEPVLSYFSHFVGPCDMFLYLLSSLFFVVNMVIHQYWLLKNKEGKR